MGSASTGVDYCRLLCDVFMTLVANGSEWMTLLFSLAFESLFVKLMGISVFLCYFCMDYYRLLCKVFTILKVGDGGYSFRLLGCTS